MFPHRFYLRSLEPELKRIFPEYGIFGIPGTHIVWHAIEFAYCGYMRLRLASNSHTHSNNTVYLTFQSFLFLYCFRPFLFDSEACPVDVKFSLMHLFYCYIILFLIYGLNLKGIFHESFLPLILHSWYNIDPVNSSIKNLTIYFFSSMVVTSMSNKGWKLMRIFSTTFWLMTSSPWVLS